MPRRSMIFATLLLVAAEPVLARTTADPEEREIAELAAKPDSWVLEQGGGKRIVLDGQTLDLRMQYLLQKGREAAVFPDQKLSQPEISPLYADNIASMPPTLVASAGFDPLRDSDRAISESAREFSKLVRAVRPR